MTSKKEIRKRIINERFAKLSPIEEKAWDFAFAQYAIADDPSQDEGAAQMAWNDLCKEFPRLRKYAGAQP